MLVHLDLKGGIRVHEVSLGVRQVDYVVEVFFEFKVFKNVPPIVNLRFKGSVVVYAIILNPVVVVEQRQEGFKLVFCGLEQVVTYTRSTVPLVGISRELIPLVPCRQKAKEPRFGSGYYRRCSRRRVQCQSTK